MLLHLGLSIPESYHCVQTRYEAIMLIAYDVFTVRQSRPLGTLTKRASGEWMMWLSPELKSDFDSVSHPSTFDSSG